MIAVIRKYYQTVKHLQPIQIRYRLLNYLRRNQLDRAGASIKSNSLTLLPSIDSAASYLGDQHFRFLNRQKKFSSNILWNFEEFGKLWTYNLNYFQYLAQEDMSKEVGLSLIDDFSKNQYILKDGMEPYPISLRSMNWIKFLSFQKINDPNINDSLYRQIKLLSNRFEFHLLGNHLLENACALLFGALYFQQKNWFDQSERVLIQQLEEQVLTDGGHFELSPMYHRIILFRLLDCINLLQHNEWPNSNLLLTVLTNKTQMMLGWLKGMMFDNGSLPQFNDSNPNIGPSSESIFDYAQRLNLDMTTAKLGDSGYRKMQSGELEMRLDVGAIGPEYITGHAHSDTFNFVLHYKAQPVIVDTGISTYEKNSQRTYERSTPAHNTVMINGREQSEVWGGFRVASRARIVSLEESDTEITASHDGYKSLGIFHQRTFAIKPKFLLVKDALNQEADGIAHIHFHPDVSIHLEGEIVKGWFGHIAFEHAESIKILDYKFAEDFNKTCNAKKIILTFRKDFQTKLFFI